MFEKTQLFVTFSHFWGAKSSKINSNNLFSLKMRADLNSTPSKTYRNMYNTHIILKNE